MPLYELLEHSHVVTAKPHALPCGVGRPGGWEGEGMTSLLVWDDQPVMTFRCHYDPDGAVREITPEQPWQPEVLFSLALLEQADSRFLRHGDGLISIYTRDEVATYGVIGEEVSLWRESVLRARLLNVVPAEGVRSQDDHAE